MRRLPLLLTLGFVFALFVVAAATAAPPTDFCGEGGTNLDHPSCSDTPEPEPEPPTLEACTTEMTVIGKGNTSFECLWTPVKVGDGAKFATVTISGLEGGVEGPPVVLVRDDSPGDICLLVQDWGVQTGPVYVESFDLYYDRVPDGYEAWLGHSYWDLEYDSEYIPTEPVVGAYWCSPQDEILETIRIDTNGTPLHFQVNFSARGGGQFEITLSPGQG